MTDVRQGPPSLGDLPREQRALVVRVLMEKMARRADIGAEIIENEHGLMIYLPKVV